MEQVHIFFRSRGYTEVRTPILVESPGMEPNLDPIGVDVKIVERGKSKGESKRGGLITSPEYSMKKLLGGGLDKIYTITPVFRNVEKMGERWSVEFFMLEWYQTGADYKACMKETEELVNQVLGPQTTNDELQTPWPRISHIDLEPHPDKFQFDVMPKLEAEHERFFVVDYPASEAALAQKNPDGLSAQRFEGYVKGIEICNGFTELVDPIEQRARFVLEQEERRKAGKEVFPIDERLLEELSSVPSPTFGNALGIDRLVMLKAGVKDIDSIHLFPPSERFEDPR